jgi:AcrR family transcriptional regulator
VASRLGAKSRVAKQKSQSVAQNPDPRAEKTRVLITTAFVALLNRRSYDRLRVSDIARKAGVGRATFYAHFPSKDALLASELVRVVLPMLAELPADPCLVDCTRLFIHVQHARDVYRSLTRGRAAGSGRTSKYLPIAGGPRSRVDDLLPRRSLRSRRQCAVKSNAPTVQTAPRPDTVAC